MNPMPDLTIVVPFFNESESLEPLYQAIIGAMRPSPLDYEMIFVDDGSADETFAIAKRLASSDQRLKVIRFRRNCGQTPAMAAGIEHARGRVIVTLDGDLQNDPRDIPMLVNQIDAGFDIAVGWRHDRQDKLITRKIPSKIANWLIGKVTGVPIKDNGCSLKAYRAAIIKEVPLYAEMHRFIPAMASIAGARVAELKVRHHARRFGESKYGLSRIYKVLVDLLTIKMITSFAPRPMYWFTILSLPFALASLFLLLQSIIGITSAIPSGWTVYLGTSLICGTVVIFLLGSGILGQMIYQVGDFTIEKLYRVTLAPPVSKSMTKKNDQAQSPGATNE